MNRINRLIRPFGLMSLAVLAVGCGADATNEQQEVVALTQELFVLRPTLWPATPVGGVPYHDVPVCWQNSGSSTEKGWVKDAITKTWPKLSLLRFTGWGTCTATSRGIRIRTADEWPHTKYLGTDIDGLQDGMVLNFQFTFWDVDDQGKPYQPFGGCIGANRQKCIRSIAVHEFGHALGFAHEQNRLDRPIACTKAPQATDGDWIVGDWDWNSVMNYCNPAFLPETLSPVDVAGVRRFYGRPNQVADYTGDRRDDYAMRWRDTAEFSIKASNGATQYLRPFGEISDVPLAADFDGDGKTDYATWRPTDHGFRALLSSTNQLYVSYLGENGDKPLVGDFDGDARNDLVVFSQGIFHVRESTGKSWSREWSAVDARPVIGDYDGDARDDIGTFKNGDWSIQTSGQYDYLNGTTGYDYINESWGTTGDLPVPGDYDGDRRNDFAVWRPSNKTFYVLRSSDRSTVSRQWGTSGDLPVPADYDGDHKTDFAVYRTSNRNWYIVKSSTGGTTTTTWGASNAIPVQQPLGNR